jgi:5'(3')-deoxyribonucleotidase
MKRFTVGVDIDGVCSNFMYAAREHLKVLFNGRPNDDQIQTGWGLDSLGFTLDEENQFWRSIDSLPNWWMHHPKMPGTSRLKELCDKHRVIFITNRKDGAGWPIEQQSAEWLKQNFWLYNPTVLISDKKGPVAEGLKLDYFIDDRPKNYEEVVNQYPKCKSALQDGTYNQEYVAGWRVKSLDDFIETIMIEAHACC